MRHPSVPLSVLALAFFAITTAGCNCRTDNIGANNGEVVVIWRNAAGERLLNRDATFDFGYKLSGQRNDLTMTVRNVGSNTLTLASLTHSEGDEVAIGAPGAIPATATSAFEAGFELVEIPPSGQREFPISFTPKGLKGSYRSVLKLTTEGTRSEDSVATITFLGEGEPGACELPSVIDFGKVAIGETFPYPLVISNPTSVAADAQAGTIMGTDAASFGYGAGSPMGAVSVPAKGSSTVTFTFRPTELKAYSAEVQMRGPGECPFQTVTLRGEGSDQTLTWSPTSINYGNVNPGSETIREVTFLNPSNVPLTLTNVTVSNPNDFYYVPDQVGATTFTVPGNSVPTKLKVACNPADLGSKTGTLTFQTGLTGNPMGSVSLTCIGGGPRIRVTPRPQLGFGRVAYFAGNPTYSVARKIRIENVGSRPVNMDPSANLYLGQDDGTGVYSFPFFELSGPDADEFTAAFGTTYNPANGLLAITGQNYVDLTVTLKPASVGMKQATMTLYSNDPAEPTITLELTADAIVPPPCDFTIVPATANFGLITPGGTKDLPVTITNTSTVAGEICYLSGIDLVAGSDPAFSIVGGAIAQKDLQPQESFQIVVRAAPTGTVPTTLQTLNGQVVVNTSSGARPQVNIPVIAAVGPACLTITPDPMDYGTIRVGCSSSSRTFNMYNTCSTPLTITGLSMQAPAGQQPGGPACPGATACPEFRIVSAPSIPGTGLSLTPGGSAPVTFQAKYTPIDVGTDSGAIAINAIQNGQTVTYLVGLQGRGDTVGVQIDTYTQDLQPKADILLVVDDSCSMGDKQTALGNNFTNFIQYAVSANVDYQIGVTTTGDADDCFAGQCPKTSRGRLVTDSSTSVRIVKPSTPNVASVFSRLVKVGTAGSGYEKPLAMAVNALTPPLIANENAGLIRPEANLAVVVISDASDQSTEPVSYYQNLMVNIKGYQRLSYFTFSAITPRQTRTPSGCQYDDQGASGSTTTENSQRYDPIVNYTSGIKDEICNSNWALALQNLGRIAFGYRTQFYLNNTPDLTAARVTVKVNNSVVPSGCPGSAGGNDGCAGQTCTTWCFDTATNAVKFNETAVPAPGVPLALEYTQTCFP